MKLKEVIHRLEVLKEKYGEEMEVKFVSTANNMLFEPAIKIYLKNPNDIFNTEKENVRCILFTMNNY